MSILIDHSLGRFQILEQLGEGGMATVYKAFDPESKREVAVKVLRFIQKTEKLLMRFEREAQALKQLIHPNIVRILEYGKQNEIPYLVMDFIDGGTLRSRLAQQYPWWQAIDLLLPIASALAYAHKNAIIHRDVKPSNILLTKGGQSRLSDFGIAKILHPEDGINLTGTNTLVGTPEYMAPEQINSKNVDARTDVYALGVILYEMIARRKPFIADKPINVLIKSMSEPLPKPSQFVGDLPESVERALLTALSRNPEDRYPSMSAFSTVLEGLLVGKEKRDPPIESYGETEGVLDQERTMDRQPSDDIGDAVTGFSETWRRDKTGLENIPMSGTISCPYCNQETPANSWSCVKCGHSLESVALMIRRSK